MTDAPQLHWLPAATDFHARLIALERASDPLQEALLLAGTRLNFVRVNALDEMVRRCCATMALSAMGRNPVRLAILGTSTLTHLHGAVRVAGLRRNIWITTYENNYGQLLQELLDESSGLHQFKPTTVLFAFDAYNLAQGVNSALDATAADAALDDILSRVRNCWVLARDRFHCPILQQTVVNVMPATLGSNEHRLPGSRRRVIDRVNASLRPMADEMGVDLLALDDRIAQDGLMAWHDPRLWHRAKQEVAPSAAPMYGELVVRLISAKLGRSAKCLVLDLDNTLWGGVIGDDGLEGIVLGQGSSLGEGFTAVQIYVRELCRRGVILAVCSKNEETNALEAFDKHPEMVLRRNDIACFRANWNDKVANLRDIACELNIGLESMVLLDDNPFERALVRQELPCVAVPEVPNDPALVPQALVDAGYFEAVNITDEDRARTKQYRGNKDRETMKAGATDLNSYLRGLQMQIVWRRFDTVGLQRIVQLIGKTNQFNLTTRRYTDEDIIAIIKDNGSFGLQLRLLDRFGDNGIIAVVIGRMQKDAAVLIDTWLMSCRVLGRQVESATLNLVVAQAQRLGAHRLVGEYIRTTKNGIVTDHYSRLGFRITDMRADGGSTSVLDLADFAFVDTFIDVKEG